MKSGILFCLLNLLAMFALQAQIAEPQFSEPQMLESLSTDEEESFPVPYDRGNKMYFVRTEVDYKGSVQQIWHSNLKNGMWEDAIKSKKLNSLSNSAVIGVSEDQQTVYLFYSNTTPRKSQRGLAYSKLKNGEWSKMQKLEIPGFDIDDGFYSFFISPSEKYILISTSPDDTSNYEDIFVSERINGKWQHIKNLGPNINTSGFEISPYLFHDDKTLYFSSNGQGGLGDADIFVSKRLDDTWQNWTRPVHLKAPINSPFFDAYFVIGTGNVVYFSSNRNDGRNSDIYQSKLIGMKSLVNNPLKLNKGEFILNGNAMAGVKFDIRDSAGNFIQQIITDEYGRFSYELLSADNTHVIELSKGQDESLVEGSLFILDEDGERKFSYKKLKNGTYSLNPFEIVEEEGIFILFGEAQKNVKLEILDENGNIIDFIFTDSEGKFNYQTLKEDKSYTIRIAEDDLNHFKNAHLYVLDELGNKSVRYRKLPSGHYTLLPMDFKDNYKMVEASFKYKNLPFANQALVIFDENNFPIDTVYTNEEGKFKFKKLPEDRTYSIRPLNLDEFTYEDLTMELNNENSQLSISKDKGMTSFNINEEEGVTKTKKVVVSVQPIVKEIGSIEQANRLFYGFNQYTLSNSNIEKLELLYKELTADSKLQVILTGHTDSIGTEDVNLQISLLRANSAKKYLMDKGINVSRLIVAGKGESKPRLDNGTAENRAKNRRVEIEIN